jgi:hypothetical protein
VAYPLRRVFIPTACMAVAWIPARRAAHIDPIADAEVVRRAKEDPASVDGAVFTTVVTKGKRDLLQRLLDAGVRVTPVFTDCQGYLLEYPDMLRREPSPCIIL